MTTDEMYALIKASREWAARLPKHPDEEAISQQLQDFFSRQDAMLLRAMAENAELEKENKQLSARLDQQMVVLVPEVPTWRWWAGDRTGENSHLPDAQAAALEAWEEAAAGPTRYRIDIEASPRMRDVLKATLYTTTGICKRWRVVYGKPDALLRNAGAPAPGHIWEPGVYKWTPERSDQPELTEKEIEALSVGLRALEEHRAALNPLAAHFEPSKLTVYHPPIPGSGVSAGSPPRSTSTPTAETTRASSVAHVDAGNVCHGSSFHEPFAALWALMLSAEQDRP